jgi:thiamine-monophosphate kinase
LGTTLKEIGERNAIRLVRTILDPTLDKGRNDDCAVLEFGSDYLLLTTDVIVEDRHFLKGTDGYNIGWLAVAVNLSDIAAKGGKPLGLVVSAAMPKGTDTKYLEDIAKGMKSCADSCATQVVGGDTKESSILTLAGFALGVVPKSKIMLRSGARPGDLLAVTGTLGLATAGYSIIKKNPKVNKGKAVDALLRPRPLLKEGQLLSGTGKVTSCMDLSDSLASSVHQLSESSNVGFEVEYEKLPIANEVRDMGLEPRDAALYFGGDYQLLLTVKKDSCPNLRKMLKGIDTDLTVIGKATKNADKILIVGNKKEKLENTSYDHFR